VRLQDQVEIQAVGSHVMELAYSMSGDEAMSCFLLVMIVGQATSILHSAIGHPFQGL